MATEQEVKTLATPTIMQTSQVAASNTRLWFSPKGHLTQYEEEARVSRCGSRSFAGEFKALVG
jgi:hypothetical protein